MLLPSVTSPKIAKDIILSGANNLTSQNALRLGFVSRIFGRGRARATFDGVFLEIENASSSHPKIGAALSTGIPDPISSERIHLLIIPRARGSVR